VDDKNEMPNLSETEGCQLTGGNGLTVGRNLPEYNLFEEGGVFALRGEESSKWKRKNGERWEP